MGPSLVERVSSKVPEEEDNMEENRRLVRRYYQEVLNARDEEILIELLAPDFRSWFGDFEVDATGYRAAVHRSLQTFGDLKVEILDQVAEGDLVATRWRATGSVGPTRMSLTAMHFHRVANGKFVEHWEELDTARLPQPPS